MYYWLSFHFFWLPKVIGVVFNQNNSKIGCFRLKSTRMKKVLRGTFWKIRRLQIQICPQTSIEPKYGAFYMKDEVSAHGLVLLVQMRWRVAPPWVFHPQLGDLILPIGEIIPNLGYSLLVVYKESHLIYINVISLIG